MLEPSFFEMIIINPWLSFGLLILIWVILHFLFLKLSERILKKIEIIYLLIGFLGILSYVFENKKDALLYKQEYLKVDINFNMRIINKELDYFCFEYTKAPESPLDFDDRKIDQDRLCEWGRQMIAKVEYDSISGYIIPLKELELFDKKKYVFKTDNNDRMIADINNIVDQTNQSIRELNTINASLKEDSKYRIRTLGVLLFILALSIRLSITSSNLYRKKN